MNSPDKNEVEDILNVTPPAGIPGVLFNEMTDKLHDFYPVSRKKAQRATVALLEILTLHYAEVAAAEENKQ